MKASTEKGRGLKPGKMKGGVCSPEEACPVLLALLQETNARRPKAGGAGLETALSFPRSADGKSIEAKAHTVYRAGKGTKVDPATVIVLEWCPFCRGPLTEASVEKVKAQPGSPGSTWKAVPRRGPSDPRRIADVRKELTLCMVDNDEAMRVEDMRMVPAAIVWELGAWVREHLTVDELPERLQQDLGLAHLDTCEHYLCLVTPCDGGARCNWTIERRADAPACKCGTV